jgi:hypothetical protein
LLVVVAAAASLCGHVSPPSDPQAALHAQQPSRSSRYEESISWQETQFATIRFRHANETLADFIVDTCKLTKVRDSLRVERNAPTSNFLEALFP